MVTTTPRVQRRPTKRKTKGPNGLRRTTAATIMTTPGRRRRRRASSRRPALGSRRLTCLLVTSGLLLLCLWSLVVVKHGRSLLRSRRPSDGVKKEEWHNQRGLVHVIQTRFMQLQPNLLSLGRARLQLFEALTVPSVAHQSNQEFLWIIRTDPALHPTLRRELIRVVQESTANAVVVASNENPEGFRDGGCVRDVTADSVVAGSVETVHSYHAAAQTHPVLETRLDADDALITQFVERVQTSAAAELFARGWRVWCARNHVEWQWQSPWANVTNTGALLGLHANRCITPGLTWGYGVGSSRAQIPVSKHHQIHEKLPQCSDDVQSQCLSKLGDEVPLALRARTPTSAGMDHVLTEFTADSFPLKRLQHSKWKDQQDELWKSLPVLFGVESTDLWNVRASIKQNLGGIVEDALQGQCTKGHSCKEESRKVLQKLLNATEQQEKIE